MKELAHDVGVSYEYVRGIEMGHKNIPPLRRLEKFAEVLEIDIVNLIHPERPVGPSPQEEASRMLTRIVNAAIDIPIRFLGTVPADSVRWTMWEEGEVTVDVPRQWLRGHDPERLFAVQLSGDCLARLGYLSGDYVLCVSATAETVRNGQLVVVRIGDEVTMKLWHRDGDRIELRDGEGRVIWQGEAPQGLEIKGVAIASWRPEIRPLPHS